MQLHSPPILQGVIMKLSQHMMKFSPGSKYGVGNLVPC